MRSLQRRHFLAFLLAAACDAPAAPSPARDAASAPAGTAASTSPTAKESAVPPTSSTQGPTASPPDAAAAAKLARSSNAFGFDLWAKIRGAKGNLVVSPASITTALAMTWGGARAATASDMKKVLHLEGSPAEVMKTAGQLASSLTDPKRGVTFRIANRLFGERTFGFEQDYLDATKDAYGAPLEAVDFKGAPEAARVHINAWVEEQTEKRVKDLIPPRAIDADMRLVLTNAIYFLGDWAEPFDKARTQPAPFFTKKGESKDVPTMNRWGTMRYAEDGGTKALELDYQGGTMSMLFVLPGEVDGLDALEQSLDAGKLDALVKALSPKYGAASLPKFELSPAQSIPLADQLKSMGMAVAFDAERADFTGIANPPSPADRLYIGNVFHKAFVRVDEKGTEAAAATAVLMPRGGSRPPEKQFEFKADHPFLFFLRDNKSGLVLFMGRVADPGAK